MSIPPYKIQRSEELCHTVKIMNMVEKIFDKFQIHAFFNNTDKEIPASKMAI